MGPLAAAVIVTALLATAGCGDQPTKASSFAGCAGRGEVLAHADLDDDGDVDDVRLVGPGAGRCAGSLTADLGGTIAGVAVRNLDLVAPHAIVVRPRGKRDVVLVRSRATATGQWQPHLFGIDGGRLAEITDHGRPVLPVVQTSRGSAPMDAACTPSGGIALFTAKAHEPPGIILAWDVTRTTFAVRGSRAVRTDRSMVKVAAADPVLRKDMPGLYDGRLFTNCR